MALSNPQIVDLARSLSSSALESIALKYLGLEPETLETLQRDSNGDEAFKQKIIQHWKNQNFMDDQVKELAAILYRAAAHGGLVDPGKVEPVLGVPRPHLDVLAKQDEVARPAGTSREDEIIEQAEASGQPEEAFEGDNMPVKKVSRNTFHRVARGLRSPTKQVMQIDVAPWMQEYNVSMERLYTELILEKVDDQLCQEDSSRVKHYRELFKARGMHRSSVRNVLSCFFKADPVDGKRVLIKGDPGMGKTTLVKKVAWDWAVGLFKAVSMILFVFLKLVRPGDSLEAIIMEHNPVLDQLGMTQGQLRDIFRKHGNRCLLILDGFDEQAQGKNQDVLKIIKGHKHLHTHVVITSRPHSTREIESHFQTVVRVDGFSKDCARQFAMKLLKDKSKVQDVMQFNPDMSLYKCPILLSFMCLLVREDDIDLSRKSITTGEIYTRMVRCLYRKYTLREKIPYDESELLKVLGRLGKLALGTLLSGKSLMKRSDVIREVGEHAFDYGLLIGHEDFRVLAGDFSNDILVTFPHRSIQEFLAALYIILKLQEGETFTNMFEIRKPLVLLNPLILHFCLWLLDEKQTYFTFTNKNKIYKKLKQLFFKRIRDLRIDDVEIVETYPAVDVKEAYRQKDSLRLKFFQEMLKGHKDSVHLLVSSVESLKWLLSVVTPSWITQKDGRFWVRRLSKEHLFLYINAPSLLESVMRCCKSYANCKLHVYFDSESVGRLRGASFRPIKIPLEIPFQERWEIALDRNALKEDDHSELPLSVLKEAHTFLTCVPGRVPKNLSSSNLKHLILYRLRFYSLSEWSRSILPNLTHLEFIDCHVKERIWSLFEASWFKLTHLIFYQTSLSTKDIESLFDMSTDKVINTLQCLALTVDKISGEKINPKKLKRWMNLASFYLHGKEDKVDIHKVINRNNLPGLKHVGLSLPPNSSLSLEKLSHLETVIWEGYRFTVTDYGVIFGTKLGKLDFSHSSGLNGNLSVLLARDFPSLKSFRLRDCGLNSEDLTSLAKARAEGRLPKLTDLDVSQNKKVRLTDLLNSCTWEGLKKLNIAYILDESIAKSRKPRCPQSLLKLTVSQPWCSSAPLENLQVLRYVVRRDKDYSKLNRTSLPSLRSICLLCKKCENSSVNRLFKDFPLLAHYAEILHTDPFRSDICYCSLEV